MENCKDFVKKNGEKIKLKKIINKNKIKFKKKVNYKL
jgi:hypothetical protein